MDLQRYAQAARNRANELLWLLSEEQRFTLQEWIKIEGNLDLESFIPAPPKRVLTILSQTPAQDQKWLEKKDRGAFFREWIAARHWALSAATAMQIGAEIADVAGGPYRKAVRNAAPVAVKLRDRPDPEDWLWLEMDD
ncbi:MAG: hypothetical protein CSA70_03515 [Rhodobacterales bacterium]|nr:MAG: hypothetical protein CSA70_03515 [Rhodobacterales bacterium]